MSNPWRALGGIREAINPVAPMVARTLAMMMLRFIALCDGYVTEAIDGGGMFQPPVALGIGQRGFSVASADVIEIDIGVLTCERVDIVFKLSLSFQNFDSLCVEFGIEFGLD